MELLPTILYILGSILLVVLIILGIKLIKTVDKCNLLIDDVTGKVKTLDGVFSVIDFTTDKLAMISDKVVDGISTFIKKLFNKKNEESESINE